MEKLFILDALGYLFRSYYAIRNLSRKTGESTNALYGFVRSVLKLMQDFKPTHMIAVFDGPNNTKTRTAIYPEYKANRQAPPEDLPHQLDWAYEFCKIAHIPVLRLPNVEADDVMATIALWAEKNQKQVYICSSDKDLFQLVSDNIFILNTNKDNLVYDANQVMTHFGVWPSQIKDYLSIVGDSSDNVPGIKGFGPKTAQELLDKAKTLDAIIQTPEVYLNDKKKEIFLNHLPQLEISRKLVSLATDIEISHNENDYLLTTPNSSEMVTFFEDMNFQSLAKEYGQTSLASTQASHKTVRPSINLVNSLVLLDELIKKLSKETKLCFDTETSHLNPMLAEIVGLGIGCDLEQIWYIPFNGTLEKDLLISKLKPLFENEKIGFFGHNIKYDLHVLKNCGIEVAHVIDDTILMSYLLTPHLRQNSLDDLALVHFNYKKIAITELIGSGKAQISMSQVDITTVANYCGEDVWMTLKLKALLEPKLAEQKLDWVYKHIELPLVKVLFHMERTGIFVDTMQLYHLQHQFEQDLAILEQEIYKLAGDKFNIKSTKQLAEILFQKLGITPTKKTKTGFSTDAEALEALDSDHPILAKVIEFRLLEKLRSTYLESLIEEVLPATKRIHCSFGQTITATGRLNCQNPNLQNIPVRTEQGREIRQAFKPQNEGWSFLAADYSQIELRLLAHFSEDPHLLEIFHNNGDIHISTAAKMFHIPIDQVTKEQRALAKAVNFGIIYGQQAFGLSKQLKIGVNDAKKFIETYFEQYPKVIDFLEKSKQLAAEKMYAESLFGRKRPLPDMRSQNKLLKQASERLAVNSPFQGTNADIIKIAMIKIEELFKKTQKKSLMILQIHDELLFEVEDSQLDWVAKEVKKIMETVITLKVPLIVDIKVGKNWKEC